MGDQHKASSLAGELRRRLRKVALGGKVERVGRFVEQEHLSCSVGGA